MPVDDQCHFDGPGEAMARGGRQSGESASTLGSRILVLVCTEGSPYCGRMGTGLRVCCVRNDSCSRAKVSLACEPQFGAESPCPLQARLSQGSGSRKAYDGEKSVVPIGAQR